MIAFCVKILLGLVLGCVFCGVVRTQGDLGRSLEDVHADDYKLELIQAMWRHGNRTPVLNFPNPMALYINRTTPFEFGQLTPYGRRSALSMGQFLRQRYDGFLPPYFTYTSASIDCTAFKRTQETAWVGMTGLWPPVGPQVWQDQGLGQLWTPIPCDYKPVLQDKVYTPYAFCPRFIELFQIITNSPKFKADVQKLTKQGFVNQYVAFNEGLPFITDLDLVIMYDYLFSLESNGHDLPHWTNLVYPHPLREIYGLFLSINTWNREATQIIMGEFWKMTMRLATTLEAGNLYPTDRVFFGHSVHDVNVAGALKSLKIFPADEAVVPTFTATFLIEWYRDTKNSSLIGAKFVYRNDTTGDLVMLTIPGCDEICPLDTIKETLADIIPITARNVYCKPVNSLILADFEAFLEFAQLWFSPEFVAEYRKLADRYLRGEQIDLR